MVASYKKVLVSSANFTNVLRGVYENPSAAASISLSAGDVVPSTRKIKKRGSKFNFIVSIFPKLLYKIIIRNRE